jgi:hypothetical protein
VNVLSCFLSFAPVVVADAVAVADARKERRESEKRGDRVFELRCLHNHFLLSPSSIIILL